MSEIDTSIVDETTPTPAPSPLPEPVEIAIIVVEQTLAELVKKYLENEDMKKKIAFQLTPEATNVINSIVTLTPDTLSDIENATLEIIKDGKIDSNDIPNLIVVIQRMYLFIYSLKNVKFDAKKRADIAASSLKYILHVLVVERKIKIDEDKQTDFFMQTNALIDSCIGLLTYSKSLKTNGCLKKLFK